jgi:hypothetical protein
MYGETASSLYSHSLRETERFRRSLDSAALLNERRKQNLVSHCQRESRSA